MYTLIIEHKDGGTTHIYTNNLERHLRAIEVHKRLTNLKPNRITLKRYGHPEEKAREMQRLLERKKN